MGKKFHFIFSNILLIMVSAMPISGESESQAKKFSYSASQRAAQQKTETTAIRGCRQNLPKMQILAPKDYVAITGERQTFLLKITDKPSSPLKVSINQPYISHSLWRAQVTVTQPGIFALTIPDSVDLQSNLDYILTVSIPCSEENTSSSKYVRIFFQYAEDKSISLDEETEAGEIVNSLLNRGLFYDALFFSYQHKLPQFKQILEEVGIQLL